MDELEKPPRWFVALICTAVLSFAMAAIAAVVPMLIGFGAIAGLVPMLWSAFRDTRRANRIAFGIASVFVAMSVFAATVYAAHLAPWKTTEQYLERKIELPRTNITLRELACRDDDYTASRYLKGVTVSISDDLLESSVDFPSTTITLRDFVATIESQTPLRRRFSHCGNGSTVLWGGDCSFGLHLRPGRNE
jgi:hypothetical protein